MVRSLGVGRPGGGGGVASLMGDRKKKSKSNNTCTVLLLLTCTTDITVCKVTAIFSLYTHAHVQEY